MSARTWGFKSPLAHPRECRVPDVGRAGDGAAVSGDGRVVAGGGALLVGAVLVAEPDPASTETTPAAWATE